MPTEPAENPFELHSWKEIASFLGVTTRTAQKWEHERALPIRRLPGSRSQVYAIMAELESWKKSCNPPPTEATASSVTPRRYRIQTVLGILIAAILATYLTARVHDAKGPPAYGSIGGNTLRMYDSSGQMVWKKEFSAALDNDWYQYFSSQRVVHLVDLNGDGNPEVLFLVSFSDRTVKGNGQLICFDNQGNERWRFNPGRTVVVGGSTYAPPYWAHNVHAFRLGGTGPWRIAVTSGHHLLFPNQLALLDPYGQIVGEHWHAGHLHSIESGDIDGDGTTELLVGGISNSERAATLLVLDPLRLDGASSEVNPNYRFLDLPPTREKARIHFHRSMLNQFKHMYNKALWVRRLPPEVWVSVLESFSGPGHGSVDYFFDARMRLIRASLSDRLLEETKQMLKVRDLSAAQVTEERDRLGQVRYLVPFH